MNRILTHRRRPGEGPETGVPTITPVTRLTEFTRHTERTQLTPVTAVSTGMQAASVRLLHPRAFLLGFLVLAASATLAVGQEQTAQRMPGTGAAAADRKTTDVPGWDEAAGLQTLAGDTLDFGARIFDSPDYQRQLLVPSVGGHAFLLGLKAKSVAILPTSALAWDSSDRPTPELASSAACGSFASEAGIVTFIAGGVTWKIQPEPPLVGEITLEQLRTEKRDYVHAAVRYFPDAAAVKALKTVTADTQIAVFFGTWCTYCKHWLPRFLKTLQAAGNPKITVEFYGVSEDQQEPKDAMKKYGVSMTPSFVVLQGGKEIGRIEENPEVSIEADLARILGAR